MLASQSKELAVASIRDFYVGISPSTIEDAITSESPMLFQMSKQYGQDSVTAFFAYGIVELNQFLNLNANVEYETIWSIAQLAIEEYNDLTFDAIKLFFKNVKLGKYGKIYGRYGGNDLLDWLRQFYVYYWQSYENFRGEKNKKDNEFVAPPPEEKYEYTEVIQRIANRLCKQGDHTDAELETMDREKEIRLRIINEHMHLYNDNSVSPEERDKIINDAIEVALHAEGIFTNN